MRWRARHTLQDKKLFDGGAAESIFYAHKRKTFKYSCVQAEVRNVMCLHGPAKSESLLTWRVSGLGGGELGPKLLQRH